MCGIQLELPDKEDVVFICLGLRDLSKAALNRVGESTSEDVEADLWVAERNTKLADSLEQQMLNQI
jgi:hypothetical protein